MFDCTLKIAGLSVGFFGQVPISINKSIADIREPGKRKADFSKTIRIPATRESNFLFEQAYQVSIDFQTFNPNKKMPGSYFVGTTEVIRGNIQLLSIPQDENTGVYEITISGKNADLFLAIGDSLLTDLDFSDLDHTLNYANFSATPVLGVGYAYGYEDRGMMGLNGYNWDVSQMKAAIFLLEYLKRIFDYAGKTFTSNIINSANLSHVTIPCNKAGAYEFSPTQIANRQFYANKTAIQTDTPTTINLAGNNYTFNFSGFYTITFTDDSTPPFNDPGGIYNTANSRFTPAVLSKNTITASVNYTFKVSARASSVNFQITSSAFTVSIFRNAGSGGVAVANYTQDLGVTLVNISGGFATFSVNTSVTYNSNYDPPGTFYTASVNVNPTFTGFFSDAGNNPLTAISGPTASLTTDTGSTFYSILSVRYLTFGNTVEMNTVVLENVKQIDFLNWIIKKFHLFIEQDPLDSTGNNYIIEDRNNFYSTGPALEIDELQDTLQDYTVTPMGELDAKTYILKDLPDQDYWNKLYQDKYKEPYGQYKYEVDNDFLQNEKVIETGFSPTPGVSFQTDIVAPRYLSIDGAFPGGTYTVKPIKVNPRILWYSGIKNCALHNLKISNVSTAHPITYPCMNHMDDPGAPTYDLNFAASQEYYYTKPAQTWTTNTRGNDHYNDFFNAIANPNSKIVEVPVIFNQNHIKEFTFRRKIHFKGSDFYVNKLSGYDPQTQAPCMLELLKVPTPKAYISVVYNPYVPPGGTGKSIFTNPEYNDAGNYGNASNANAGRNLVNGSDTGLLIGENVSVDRAVKSFTGIGIKDKVLGLEVDGKVMITEGLMVGDDGIEALKLSNEVQTTSFTVTKAVSFVDATAGSLVIILKAISDYSEQKIVRVDSSINTVTVRGPGGIELIKSTGVSTVSDILPAQTTRNYGSNGTAYYY